MLMRFDNWDRQFVRGQTLAAGDPDWLRVHGMGQVRKDCPALQTCLIYNGAFYVFLFFAFNGVAYLWSRLPQRI